MMIPKIILFYCKCFISTQAWLSMLFFMLRFSIDLKKKCENMRSVYISLMRRTNVLDLIRHLIDTFPKVLHELITIRFIFK